VTPEARAQAIEESEGPKLRALVKAAAKLATMPGAYPAKAARVMDIADAIGRTITPFTPCGGGCSHCCHMATALSGFEARMIGTYVGREPARLGREMKADRDVQAQLIDRFTGVPCPFLEGGRCTVYAVRPIACRIHHSMNDDETDCRIVPGERIVVPRINLEAFLAMQALIMLPDDFGDIREFFPPVDAQGEP
jgi:Fe-S-cluster containining protein